MRQRLVDKVVELKQANYRLAIITNNVREFSDAWRSLIPVDELFDEVVDSCVEGMRKPAASIFELALARMGNVSPQESLFLDDHPANVKAAEQLGIRSILVDEDDSRVIAELDSYI